MDDEETTNGKDEGIGKYLNTDNEGIPSFLVRFSVSLVGDLRRFSSLDLWLLSYFVLRLLGTLTPRFSDTCPEYDPLA